MTPMVRGKVRKGGFDHNGRQRKIIEINNLYYDDFEFGEAVDISKIE
jgi:hypothetical protein